MKAALNTKNKKLILWDVTKLFFYIEYILKCIISVCSYYYSLQCYMFLQKSFCYSDLVLDCEYIISVLLLKINVFQDSLMNRMFKSIYFKLKYFVICVDSDILIHI